MTKERDEANDQSRGSKNFRRYVTVLFADLCSSTRLGHSSDPEVLDQLLQEIKAAAFRVIDRHNGIVVQFHGDGVFAIFGHPIPQEDDVRHATEAALELHREIRDLNVGHLVPESFQVRLHSGIHAGLVLLRDGGSVQGCFEIVGDPPNTAAGLCSYAAEDEILVSASTLRGDRQDTRGRGIHPRSRSMILLSSEPPRGGLSKRLNGFGTPRMAPSTGSVG
jgi:class 3 adenylate cyclase